MSLADAIWATPLVIAMVLMPVRNERHGGSSGPDYVTSAGNRASSRAEAFLSAHFQIVNKPLSHTGWLLGGDTILKI